MSIPGSYKLADESVIATEKKYGCQHAAGLRGYSTA